MYLLIAATIARMTACTELQTALPCLLLALSLRACLLSRIFKYDLTEPAFLSVLILLVLLTVFTKVIRFGLA